MKRLEKIISMMLIATLFMTVFVSQSSVIAEAKTFVQTGTYYTGLSTKKDKSDEYYSYAKKLVFKSNKFTAYGTMHYTKPGDVYSFKIYKKAKRTYVIAGSCKYYKQTYKNGKMSKKKISKKKLKKLVLPLDSGKYSNRTLRWKIQGGKVVELIYEEY